MKLLRLPAADYWRRRAPSPDNPVITSANVRLSIFPHSCFMLSPHYRRRREFISEDPESIREPKSSQEDPMSRAIPRALAYYSRMRENAYILELEDLGILRYSGVSGREGRRTHYFRSTACSSCFHGGIKNVSIYPRDACGISVLMETAKEEVNGDRACECVHTWPDTLDRSDSLPTLVTSLPLSACSKSFSKNEYDCYVCTP